MSLLACALACLALAQSQSAPAAETIVELRVHGNHTTPDAEVLRLSGVSTGQPFKPRTSSEIRERLEASRRFRSIDVRKRYVSISDPTAILVVIVVEEVAGISIDVPSPGPLRRLRANTMWLPVLRYDDGYGLSYGARFTFVNLLGRGTRVSTPLTWGGERRAAVEIERGFSRGPLTRLQATGGIWQSEHPSDDVTERRVEAIVRAERSVAPWMRVGASGRTAEVNFGGERDPMQAAGFDATIDTRRDPAFPRNAVYVAGGWDRLWFGGTPDTFRTRVDARGYLGVFGQTVLAVRGLHLWAADPLPPWEQPLLGGTATLRGYRLGYRTGDRLAAASAELRIPVSSPRGIGRAGIAIFADTGAVSDVPVPLSKARFDTGVGAGWFLHAPLVGLRLDVAHAVGGGTRVHFSMGVTF
jgi:outer membrane protein assembly factor BamA